MPEFEKEDRSRGKTDIDLMSRTHVERKHALQAVLETRKQNKNNDQRAAQFIICRHI
jgi:hypothetical protein